MTGNRLERGECLKCGTPLIWPFNEYRMCTEHTAWLMAELYRQKTTPRNKDKVPKIHHFSKRIRYPKGAVGRKVG